MTEAGKLPLDRYRFFLDVFDADSGALVTSAQLRTPAACGHVFNPGCDCSSDDERALDAAVAASGDGGGAPQESPSVQRGVTLPVPVASWPAKVRFRVLILRTADGALAQVMHAAAVSRGVLNGDTKRFAYPPSAEFRRFPPGADEDEDEGDDDGTRVAQGSHHAHDPQYIDFSATVQVVARGSVAILTVECDRSTPHGGDSFNSEIDQWTSMLPCLMWAAPPPRRAPAFFEAAADCCADGVMPPDMMQLLARHLAALTPSELAAAARTQNAWGDLMLAAGAPALARHLEADAAAAGMSWRALAAQVSDAQRRPTSWQDGEVDGLSDLTFLLEASCSVSDVADADDNETVPGARRVLLYSGAFRVARQPCAQSPGKYEFAGGAENALVAAAPFRPIFAADQLPAHLASALPVWADMDDARSWLDGAAAMRVSLYALRASDGAVTQLSSERKEQLGIWDDDDIDTTKLDLCLQNFGTCNDGLQRLAFTRRPRDHLCRMGTFVSLIWPAAAPQLPRSAQRASEGPRAELRLYDEEGHGALGMVTLSPQRVNDMDVLHALAHADWQLPVA